MEENKNVRTKRGKMFGCCELGNDSYGVMYHKRGKEGKGCLS
jgi:hypothetical protein